MNNEHRWFLPVILTAGGLFLYFSFPLWVEAAHSLVGVFILVTKILPALPKILWWVAGVALLGFWAIAVFLKFARMNPKNNKEKKVVPAFPGRLAAIQSTLSRAGSGRYSREEIRNLLRSQAVSLIALEMNISEEESWKIFQKGDWTEDSLLRDYFFEVKDPKEKKWSWRPRFGKSDPTGFLEKTRTVLERLWIFDSFSNRKGKYDPPDINL